jgi:hypothetical protein
LVLSVLTHVPTHEPIADFSETGIPGSAVGGQNHLRAAPLIRDGFSAPTGQGTGKGVGMVGAVSTGMVGTD